MSDTPKPDAPFPPLSDIPPLDPLPDSPPLEPFDEPDRDAPEGEPPTIPEDVPFIVPPGTQ
jgi:hypothetical protein